MSWLCSVVSVWCSYWWFVVVFFFFFKQKTAYEMRISDWSSDVCSSDLRGRPDRAGALGRVRRGRPAGRGALRLARRRVLHDRPDQPRLRDHGAVRRGLLARRQEGGDRHPWLTWSTSSTPTPTGRRSSCSARSWRSCCRCRTEERRVGKE